MDRIFLPTLHTFAMENTFTGSCGDLRFKITPTVTKLGKEVDFENSNMFAEFWYGPFCYEKSQIVDAQTFPMSDEGRKNMLSWLISKIQ